MEELLPTQNFEHIYQNDHNEKVQIEHESILKGYDKLTIASRTDTKGVITYVSKEFVNVTGYQKSELIGKNHNIVRHPDTPSELFEKMWETIKKGETWEGKFKNLKKNGDFFWSKNIITPYYDKEQNLIGYNCIKKDITSNMQLRKLHKKVLSFLNSSNDIYFFINKKYKIEGDYSYKAKDIFNLKNLKDMDISDALFKNNKNKKELLLKGIDHIFANAEDSKREVLLSLLPKEAIINEKYINITYKMINNELILLILKDISETKRLQKELQLHKQQQKMIIQAAANMENFCELYLTFTQFCTELFKTDNESIQLPDNYDKLLNDLHTFKGIFYHMHLYYTPQAIHKMESKIIHMLSRFKKRAGLDDDENIKLAFERDIDIIKDVLGNNFLQTVKKDKIRVPLLDLKSSLKKIVDKPVTIGFKIQGIRSQFDLNSYIDIYSMLKSHGAIIEDLSNIFNKPMNELNIIGDKDIKVPPTFKELIRNFVHIYKNIMDHGIEEPAKRIDKNKPLKANILCRYYYQNDDLIIEISDDGMGINPKKILAKAIEKGIVEQKDAKYLTEEKIYEIMFHKNFSTKKSIDEISGRGIGMYSLKESLKGVNGKLKIINDFGYGLKYFFKIPMPKAFNAHEHDKNKNEVVNIINTISDNIKEFLSKKLFINLLDEKYTNEYDSSNKEHILVDIGPNKELIISLSVTKNIAIDFCEKFYPHSVGNISEDETYDEILKEFINIIIGSSLHDLPIYIKHQPLSEPYKLEPNKINELLETNNAMAYKIKSEHGEIVCKVIQKRR